jgi:hypothetical protein
MAAEGLGAVALGNFEIGDRRPEAVTKNRIDNADACALA